MLLAVAMLQSEWLPPPQAVTFLCYGALLGGALLTWRFHSSRIAFALLAIFATQQAASILHPSQLVPGTAGWMALQTTAVLLPLTFIVIALMQERGFTLASTLPVFLLFFVEFVFVAVLYRGNNGRPSAGHVHHSAMASWPRYVWLLLIVSGSFLLVRYLLTRKPADSALFWSLGGAILSLRFVSSAAISTLYSAASAAILAISIVENSYLLAYHDELTALPSRRSWNDALLRIQHPYSIAVVDIDHFKRFNDTYGHDTGDQVLRLVASTLSRVTGGGQAFRCGGEEFAILFPGKSGSEVFDHLEQLRAQVEKARFHLRSGERRQAPRGPDRRNIRNAKPARLRNAAGRVDRGNTTELSVTVSIGLAWSASAKSDPDTIQQTADKALYRAKANGRNRVEAISSMRRRVREKSAGIA